MKIFNKNIKNFVGDRVLTEESINGVRYVTIRTKNGDKKFLREKMSIPREFDISKRKERTESRI